MRQLLSNISAISNLFANTGSLLNVCAEATRSRGADSVSALVSGASYLTHEMRHALRHWPIAMWLPGVCVPAASCFVITKQRQRQHYFAKCRRPAA